MGSNSCLSSPPISGHIICPLILFVFVSILSVFLVSKNRKKGKSTPILPPGPKPWPLIANLPQLYINKPRFRWVERVMDEMNSDIACIRVGNVHIIPVRCPEIAREFLKKEDAIFASRPFTMASEYVSYMYKSVAVSPMSDHYKKMKKALVSNILSARTLNWLHDKRLEEADNIVRYIYDHYNNNVTVDIRHVCRTYAVNIIRRQLFNKRYFSKGSSSAGPGAEDIDYGAAFFDVIRFTYTFCVSDYVPSFRIFDLDGHEKIIRAAFNTINKYHVPIINERMKEWRTEEGGFKSADKKPEDLVDIFISLKDASGAPLLSQDEIIAQSVELTVASIDNTSNVVEWALAEIISSPEIHRKAVEEIDRVVGTDRFVQESDFPKLNYIKACVREAFRLHPVDQFNAPHMSTAEATVAGYFIPKGSHILLSRHGLGRNPKVWDEPLKFKPERHFNDPVTEVKLIEPDLRFISFSTGRRGCVGVALGSAMTIMLLTRCLQAFDWAVPPGEECIELAESADSLFLAKSLHLLAKPRLPAHVYARE